MFLLKAPNRVVFVCLALVITCGYELVADDGILGNGDAKEKAEDALLDFLSDGELIDTYVCVGRSKSAVFSQRVGEAVDVERWFAEACGKKQRYSGANSQNYRMNVPGTPIWEQTLISEGRKHVRRSIQGNGVGQMFSVDKDADKEEYAFHRSMPAIDPYYVSVLDWVSLSRGQKGVQFGEFFLANFQLDDAEWTRAGLASTWSRVLKDGVVFQAEILFDPKQGNRPSRVEWSYKGEAKNPRIALRASWSRKTLVLNGKREEIWLPHHVVRLDRHGKGGFTESEYILLWTSFKKEMIPAVTDQDWRLPIAEALEIDWQEPFASFKARFAK